MADYFYWWYSAGLKWAFQVASFVVYRLSDFFSVNILLKTLFSPWKNDVLRAQNISLGDQFKLWQQNSVSRLVGFVIRLILLLIALLALVASSFVLTLSLLVWLLTPVLIITLPVAGLLIFLKS